MYQASTLALRGIERSKDDKFTYFACADVGTALMERFGEVDVLDDAILRMQAAAEFILDPHFLTELARLEGERRRIFSSPDAEGPVAE